MSTHSPPSCAGEGDPCRFRSFPAGFGLMRYTLIDFNLFLPGGSGPSPMKRLSQCYFSARPETFCTSEKHGPVDRLVGGETDRIGEWQRSLLAMSILRRCYSA